MTQLRFGEPLKGASQGDGEIIRLCIDNFVEKAAPVASCLPQNLTVPDVRKALEVKKERQAAKVVRGGSVRHVASPTISNFPCERVCKVQKDGRLQRPEGYISISPPVCLTELDFVYFRCDCFLNPTKMRTC